jgi:uncharacterized protein
MVVMVDMRFSVESLVGIIVKVKWGMSLTALEDEPASPCNKICVLDSAGALCTGCYRTLDEIAKWSEFSPSEKRAVLALLPHRRALDAS